MQHRPVRARRDGVHANASFRHLFSQRFSEDRETGFGLRIIEQDRAGFIRLHRGGIDNRASGLEVRQCGAGDPERRVDVGFKGSVEVFGSEFLKGFTVLLTPGVINQDAQTSQLFHRVGHQRLAEGFGANITREGHRGAPFGFDQGDNFIRILLLFGQIVYRDFGAFAGKGDRHRTANTGVAAGN